VDGVDIVYNFVSAPNEPHAVNTSRFQTYFIVLGQGSSFLLIATLQNSVYRPNSLGHSVQPNPSADVEFCNLGLRWLTHFAYDKNLGRA